MNGPWPKRMAGDRALLLTCASLAGALFLFLKIASEVVEGESHALDSRILEAVRAATDGESPVMHWLRSFMLDVTGLGNPNILILISVIAIGYLIVERRFRLAAILAGGLSSGALLEIGLKHVFGRARPDLVDHLVDVGSASFPSGHAMDSAMVYLTIAALLTRAVTDRIARIYIFSVALALTGLIGLSRLYLGVHWPTDILAGWIAGTAWAALFSLFGDRLAEARPGD